jgi:hypothetical protein
MNRVCSIFAQLLQLFPRVKFQEEVNKHQAERHSRGFSCWGQFVAMLFCQVGQAKSLREICNGLMAIEGKLKHLGVSSAPNKSTLAYANGHRPWELYQSVFNQLLARCHQQANGSKKFRFKNKLVSMDSSTIDLCASVFDWAKFKRAKGAVKVHLLLDHEGYLPCFAHITDGKSSDIAVARGLKFQAGTIVVMDRGYVDYGWWEQLTKQGVYFVTRLKKDILWDEVESRKPPQNCNVIRDQIIRVRPSAQYKIETKFRIVTILVKEGEELSFLTNHVELGATTIAKIYKDRWQIETFFKCLKQLARVKTFVGTSANALKTQIWAALIAVLILKFLQLKSKFNWSLSHLVALLRQQLFVYRDLYIWLDDPFQAPPALAGLHDGQLQLEF